MTIREILTNFKKIAVIGLSPDTSKASNSVTQYMIEQGYDIVGVRPGATTILERPCFENIADVPKPLEIVNVFRDSKHIPEIVDTIIPLKPKVLWLQEGVTNKEAEEKAQKAGICVVSDKCILKEHMKINTP